MPLCFTAYLPAFRGDAPPAGRPRVPGLVEEGGRLLVCGAGTGGSPQCGPSPGEEGGGSSFDEPQITWLFQWREMGSRCP